MCLCVYRCMYMCVINTYISSFINRLSVQHSFKNIMRFLAYTFLSIRQLPNHNYLITIIIIFKIRALCNHGDSFLELYQDQIKGSYFSYLSIIMNKYLNIGNSIIIAIGTLKFCPSNNVRREKLIFTVSFTRETC